MKRRSPLPHTHSFGDPQDCRACEAAADLVELERGAELPPTWDSTGPDAAEDETRFWPWSL